MPPSTQVWRIPRFDGGLVTNTDSKHLKAHQTPDCANVHFDPGGALVRREGYKRMHSVALGAGGAPESIGVWADGRFVVVSSDGKLFVVTDSSSPLQVASGRDVADAHGNQSYTMDTKAFVHNRAQGAVRVEVGTSPAFNATSISSSFPADWFTGTSTDFPVKGTKPASSVHPKAAYAGILRDRVWVGNIKEKKLKTDGSFEGAESNFFSRVRFSELTNPTAWAYNNYIDVVPDDNDEITGLAPVFNRLVVFKRNSIYQIAGDVTDNFQVVPLSVGVGGCSSPRTIARWDGGVIFAGVDGIKNFDGSRLQHLSLPIDPIPGVPKSGVVVNRRYYLSVLDAGVLSVYVYDIDYKWWTKYTNFPAKWMVSDTFTNAAAQRLIATADNSGHVLNCLTGDKDNDGAIDAYWTSGWQDLGVPEAKKRTRRIFLTTHEATEPVLLRVYRDWNDSEPRKEVVAEVVVGDHSVRRTGAVGPSRSLRFRLENVSGGLMHVDQLSVTYVPRPLR